MKIKKSILGFTAAAALAAEMLVPMETMAVTAYTPVAGTSFSFNTYFIMDAGDTVPNTSFSFSISPGSARSSLTSDNAVMQVLPGVGSPSIANITFTYETATKKEAGTNIDVARTNMMRCNKEGSDTVQLDSGEKYATAAGTADFSGVTFTEPGIYRYVITETASTDHANAGIIHDTDPDRILDVYVTDDGTGKLAVSSYVLHTVDDDVPINLTMGSAGVSSNGNALADKTDGFTNEYISKDLVFKKEVTGNQASRDKWFAFTATVTNIKDEDVFAVSLAADTDDTTTDGKADAKSGATDATIENNRGKDNLTSVTGAQLKAGQKFYLQHGQSIAIRGLAPNATYSITENAEDYKSTAAAVEGYTNAVEGTMSAVAGTNKAVKTSYLNERTGVIPTGIANKSVVIAAGIVTICAAAIAMIFYFRRRRV